MHSRQPNGSVTDIGQIGGFTITSTLHRDHKGVVTLTLALTDVPASEFTLSANEVANAALITRLENKLTGLDTLHSHARTDIERLGAEVEQARTQLAEPFRQHEQLTAARARLDHINVQIDGAGSDGASPSPAAGNEVPAHQVDAEPANAHDDQGHTASVADATGNEPLAPVAVPGHAGAVVEDQRRVPAATAEPSPAALADDALREQMGQLVQRFYEARWYGTATQARQTAADFRTVLREHARRLTVSADQVEIGDFVRAVGINLHTGEPESVSGIVVDNLHTSRRLGDDVNGPREWGHWMKIQLPQRADVDAPMLEVYVRGEPVLRLPAPVDRGRPDWIDADTAPAVTPSSAPAPNTESRAAPGPPEPAARTADSVRRILGTWLTTQRFTADISTHQRRWLADRIAHLANNPRIRQAARVNDEDNFGLVFTRAVEDDLVEALIVDADNASASLYFREKDFASGLDNYARHAVYRVIRDEDNPQTAAAAEALKAELAMPRCAARAGAALARRRLTVGLHHQRG